MESTHFVVSGFGPVVRPAFFFLAAVVNCYSFPTPLQLQNVSMFSNPVCQVTHICALQLILLYFPKIFFLETLLIEVKKVTPLASKEVQTFSPSMVRFLFTRPTFLHVSVKCLRRHLNFPYYCHFTSKKH